MLVLLVGTAAVATAQQPRARAAERRSLSPQLGKSRLGVPRSTVRLLLQGGSIRVPMPNPVRNAWDKMPASPAPRRPTQQGLVARIGDGPLASEGRGERACAARCVAPRGGPSRLLVGRPLARLSLRRLASRRTLPLARAARAHRAGGGQPTLEPRDERALLRRGGWSEGPALRGARGSSALRPPPLSSSSGRSPPRSTSRPTAGASSSSRGPPARRTAT
jgi:hypothetical protein